MLGVVFLALGSACLILRHFLMARVGDALKKTQVFNNVSVMQFYFGAAIMALLTGSVLVIVALIAYA